MNFKSSGIKELILWRLKFEEGEKGLVIEEGKTNKIFIYMDTYDLEKKNERRVMEAI